MKSKVTFYFSILFICILLLQGCSSDCDKCDEAIQHMWSKIEQQFCNTNSMQEAADRIREDCENTSTNAELVTDVTH